MSAIGGKMASLTKYRGRWSVQIRRKGHRGIYETFVQKSDARSFFNLSLCFKKYIYYFFRNDFVTFASNMATVINIIIFFK